MRILIAVDDDGIGAEVLAAAARWTRPDDEVHALIVLDPTALHPTYSSNAPPPVPAHAGGIPGNQARLVPMIVEVPLAPVESAVQASERVCREREELLRRMLAGVRDGSRWHVHVAIGRDAAEAILHAGDRLAADLIVTGTHGRTGVAAVFLGSVAQGVIRDARVPVLVVRKGTAARRAAGPVEARTREPSLS